MRAALDAPHMEAVPSALGLVLAAAAAFNVAELYLEVGVDDRHSTLIVPADDDTPWAAHVCHARRDDLMAALGWSADGDGCWSKGWPPDTDPVQVAAAIGLGHAAAHEHLTPAAWTVAVADPDATLPFDVTKS